MQNEKIKYYDEIENAYKLILDSSFNGIGKAYDCGDNILFIADDPDEIFYTCREIIVDKATKTAKWYTLYEALKNPIEKKQEILIPDNYRFKEN